MVREKKKKQPFWKKTSPELKHVTDHIGKVIDNSKLTDFIEFFIYAGLAYVGAEKLKDWRGALIGPIGLKLATSMNIVAGTAGIAILGVLGLASIGSFISPPRRENDQIVIDVGEQTYPIHCERVGPPGAEGEWRCWYPGLGWRYGIDPSLFE